MIVGITGYKGSGKDEATSVFIQEAFIHYKFANALKEALKILFLWDERHIEGELKEEIDMRWGISPRQAMQFFGTEIGRELLPNTFPLFKEKNGSDFWVRYFRFWYSKNFGIFDANIVISDVRFPNEVECVRSMGGVILRITRPSQLNNIDSHKSEAFIETIHPDFEIFNTKSLDDFREQVRSVYKLIMNIREEK